MSDINELVQKIGQLLKEKQWKLGVAESCTGGLVAGALTALSGSSDWFDRGYVVYSDQAKQDLLKIPLNLLKRYSAYSEETAKAMALGVIKQSSVDVSFSTTGIAGPTGGTKEKPVGSVYFAWANRQGAVRTLFRYFSGNRQEIREQAVQIALEGLLNFLMVNF